MKLREPVYGNGYIAIAELPTGQMLITSLVTSPAGDTLTVRTHSQICNPFLDKNNSSAPSSFSPMLFHSVGHFTFNPSSGSPTCCRTFHLSGWTLQPEWWGSLARNTMVCAGVDGVLSGCQLCFFGGGFSWHYIYYIVGIINRILLSLKTTNILKTGLFLLGHYFIFNPLVWLWRPPELFHRWSRALFVTVLWADATSIKTNSLVYYTGL